MSHIPSILGASPIRKEGRAKVTGQAQYVDDISLPGMWYGATVRSSIARGRILSITFDPAIDWSEFTVVTAADIPGENCIIHLTNDHVCLAAEQINHYAEPILLLAHPDPVLLVIFALNTLIFAYKYRADLRQFPAPRGWLARRIGYAPRP